MRDTGRNQIHMKQILFILCLVITVGVFAQTDSTEMKLNNYKQLFINGTITSQEYETLRKKTLGIEIKPQETKVVEAPIDTFGMTSKQLYTKGWNDGQENYRNGSAFAGSFFCTLFLSPIIGLAPTIVSTATKPAEDKLNYPDKNIFKNPDYNRGYMAGAKRTKTSAAWGGWGGAFALQVMTGIVVGVIVRKNQLNKR